ncbi:hypothetical protein DFJ73DRAFT_949861 [Zopfochytrium polystomum]|nr:hypothetical protein DFJ73DRAFT_949861 [Zopfochytrium polystomum]
MGIQGNIELLHQPLTDPGTFHSWHGNVLGTFALQNLLATVDPSSARVLLAPTPTDDKAAVTDPADARSPCASSPSAAAASPATQRLAFWSATPPPGVPGSKVMRLFPEHVLDHPGHAGYWTYSDDPSVFPGTYAQNLVALLHVRKHAGTRLRRRVDECARGGFAFLALAELAMRCYDPAREAARQRAEMERWEDVVRARYGGGGASASAGGGGGAAQDEYWVDRGGAFGGGGGRRRAREERDDDRRAEQRRKRPRRRRGEFDAADPPPPRVAASAASSGKVVICNRCGGPNHFARNCLAVSPLPTREPSLAEGSARAGVEEEEEEEEEEAMIKEESESDAW